MYSFEIYEETNPIQIKTFWLSLTKEKSDCINQSMGYSLFQNEARSLHRKSAMLVSNKADWDILNEERTDAVLRCLEKAAWTHE